MCCNTFQRRTRMDHSALGRSGTSPDWPQYSALDRSSAQSCRHGSLNMACIVGQPTASRQVAVDTCVNLPKRDAPPKAGTPMLDGMNHLRETDGLQHYLLNSELTSGVCA